MGDGPGDALDVNTRREIYTFLREVPGAHFSEIQRRLDLATGTLQYHLRYLEKRDLIEAKRDGRYTRYYPSMEVDRRHKPILGLLRQSTPRRLVLDLIEHGPSRLTDMSDRLDLAPSTLSFHLKKLMKEDIVERPERGVYQVVDREGMLDLLVTYRSSFIDSAVDRIVNLFTGVNPGHLEERGEEDT